MNPVVEKREDKRNEDDSDEFDSNVYNSADSFIADDEESVVDSSEDSDFDPASKPRPAPKKYSGLTKEEVEMANDNIKKTRNRRLKKMKEKTQRNQDDFVEYEEDPIVGDDVMRDGPDGGPPAEQFGAGLEEHHDLLRNIFNDDMFADEAENEGKQADSVGGDGDFSKMLPPEEQQRYFLTELDQRIKKKDIPERLQIRFSGRPEIVPEEMVHEARWIVRKLIERNRLSDKMEAFLEVKVYGVLENLLWKNQEVMYIWMYSRQDITSNTHNQNRMDHSYELTLDDLWFIYFADEEWQRCSEMRISLTKLMKLLEQHCQLSGLAKMAFDNAMDFEHLTACYEYLKFRLKCFIDEDQIEQLLEDQPQAGAGERRVTEGGTRIKRMKKPNRLKEMHKYGMDKVAFQISLTPEQLADNFENGQQTHTPTLLRQRPNELSEEVSREDVGYLSRPVDTLTAICKMLAAKYFFHPIIRMHLKKICEEKVCIVTRPTDKGRKTLNVYHYYFPTKRITGKRMSSIDPLLWMLVVEAEAKGLVSVQFSMDYDRDFEWQSLMRKIKRLLLDEREPKNKNEALLLESWNQVRTSIADNLIKLYAKPVFEKEFRKHLTKLGRESIVAEIKKEFKQIINIKPYQPSRQTHMQEDNGRAEQPDKGEATANGRRAGEATGTGQCARAGLHDDVFADDKVQRLGGSLRGPEPKGRDRRDPASEKLLQEVGGHEEPLQTGHLRQEHQGSQGLRDRAPAEGHRDFAEVSGDAGTQNRAQRPLHRNLRQFGK